MLKNNINKLIEAMNDGKYIRPKHNRKLRVTTTVPTLRVTYVDPKLEKTINGFIDHYPKISETYFTEEGATIKNPQNIESLKIVGSSSFKTYEIEYIYFNPQCNRTLAKCTNGYVIDYGLNLTKFFYEEFEIITKEQIEKEKLENKPVKKVTMEEVYAKFGYPVEIIE